jgi:membrane-associated phospholipid phosphatase
VRRPALISGTVGLALLLVMMMVVWLNYLGGNNWLQDLPWRGPDSTLSRVATLPSYPFRWISPADVYATQLVQEVAAEGTWLRFVLKLPNWLFKWWTFVLVAGLLLLHPNRHRLLLGYSTVLVVGFGTTHLLKSLLGRARPDLNIGPHLMLPIGDPRMNFDSFPSGHTTSATLVALLTGIYFPKTRWILYPAAVMVGLARVAQDRHFVSDILAGFALAAGSVLLCRYLLGPSYFHRVRFGKEQHDTAPQPLEPSAPAS